jgi:outer membrane immunogenic protein
MTTLKVSAVLASALLSTTALAADIPAPVYKARPATAAIYDWTGFYVGANWGAAIGQSRQRSTTPPPVNGGAPIAEVSDTGLTAGLQAGFNWQFAPAWLVGIEGDFGYLGIKRTNKDWFDDVLFGVKADRYATIRGRLGYVTGPSLLYVTGGAAFVHVENTQGGNLDIAPVIPPVTHSTTKAGWTFGAGIETKLTRNWSAKSEFLYIDAGDVSFASNPYGGSDNPVFRNEFYVIRSGLNYRFGGPDDGALFSGAPLPARDWSGAYAGVNAGLGVSTTHYAAVTGPWGEGDINGRGFAGGVQAGYNVMLSPKIFAGIEGDIGYLGLDRSEYDWGDAWRFSQKTDWYGTLRGRLGVSTGPALLYVTGGGAAVRVTTGLEAQSGIFNSMSRHTDTALGWTFGGGTEVALDARWSAKIEALHIDVGDQTERGVAPGIQRDTKFQREFQVVRAGLNYQFNAPVAAKY